MERELQAPRDRTKRLDQLVEGDLLDNGEVVERITPHPEGDGMLVLHLRNRFGETCTVAGHASDTEKVYN